MHGCLHAWRATQWTTEVMMTTRAPYLPPLADQAMDELVQTRLQPQLAFFFDKLKREMGAIRIDGVPALKSNDLFLPGKIALGLGYILLNTRADDPALPEHLQTYRDIAELTAPLENQSWGIY